MDSFPRFVKEEKKMAKYRSLRVIAANTIWEASKIKDPCFCEHFKRLLYHFRPLALTSPIPFDDVFISWIHGDNERIKWLIDNKFIEKIEEVSYSIGDRFVDNTVLGDRFVDNKDEYILASVDEFITCNGMAKLINLINLKTGQRLKTHIRVKDLYNITEDEFKAFVGNTILNRTYSIK